MKKIQFTGVAFLLAILFAGGVACTEQEVPKFGPQNALWFDNYYWIAETNTYVYYNDVTVSATFYPGQTEYIQDFPLNLVGPKLAAPKRYDLVLVDSLSDADVGQYIEFPEVMEFKAGSFTDVLNVKVLIGEIPEGYTGQAVYTLVANENFADYATDNTIKITVNNVPTQPLWWDRKIEQAYLGEYSKEKFAAFVECTGLITLEGMSAMDMRKVCRKFKEYVRENGLDMEVPIY